MTGRLSVLVAAGGLALTLVAQPEPVTLRVALYPFVPQAQALFQSLEAPFERAHPGVNVELVDEFTDRGGQVHALADDYYRGGLEQTDADIYEIDTVLLADMAPRLQPAPPDRIALRPDFGAAVTVDGRTLGVPHWICGNFLFYRRDDAAIRDAQRWSDLGAALQGGGILSDLKGTSTLGEWYLTALASRDGTPQHVLDRLADPSLDGSAVKSLQDLLGLCPAGYCRSDAFHQRTGFYARLFARGRSRGYIGYSESLHYALGELRESCAPGDGCLREDDIAVRALPLDAPGGRRVGWLDALALDARLSGRKKDLAADFVAWATSWEAYKIVLTPTAPDPPRYLLPARLGPHGELPEAPLYPAFEAAFQDRLFLTADRLNATLRGKATALNCALPAERDDTGWAAACGKPR